MDGRKFKKLQRLLSEAKEIVEEEGVKENHFATKQNMGLIYSELSDLEKKIYTIK